MSILECKKLNIGYPDKVICKDINFEVNKGDYLCIIGENGSGKSTLLKSILGLNKIISGKVVFAKDFNKTMIGYLPQQTSLQKDFPATVKEIIYSGFVGQMGIRPFYNSKEKLKAKTIIKDLNLETFVTRSYKELSGGQQQRVLLARALCATDELLVLDEPTNGLDVKNINKFYELLSELNKKGITIVMVSHNIDKVVEYASKIVYLKNTMLFNGMKEDFINTDIYKSLTIGEN